MKSCVRDASLNDRPRLMPLEKAAPKLVMLPDPPELDVGDGAEGALVVLDTRPCSSMPRWTALMRDSRR